MPNPLTPGQQIPEDGPPAGVVPAPLQWWERESHRLPGDYHQMDAVDRAGAIATQLEGEPQQPVYEMRTLAFIGSGPTSSSVRNRHGISLETASRTLLSCNDTASSLMLPPVACPT